MRSVLTPSNTKRIADPVCRRGVVHAAAVRRAVGVVRQAAQGVPQLPHAERVAEEGVPAPHHHPELRPGEGEQKRRPSLC